MSRVALCLSGGGYRAALFHLGALRRLNERGLLSRVDRVSAVSGGSMFAAHLAAWMREGAKRGVPWPAAGDAWPLWDEMARAFHEKLDRPVQLLSSLSGNEALLRALPRGMKAWVGDMRLAELPERPDILFTATELHHGHAWTFSRTRVGSPRLGHSTSHGHALVAEAVTASACFPPILRSVLLKYDPAVFLGGTAPPAAPCDVWLSDGGVLDNNGLEGAWDADVILVSDGGRPSTKALAAPSLFQLGRPPTGDDVAALRAIGRIHEAGVGAQRLRQLHERFARQEAAGAHWRIDEGVAPSAADLPGYAEDVAKGLIAAMRTDMDGFTEGERRVLENHGYVMAEQALRTQAPSLAGSGPPLRVPHEHGGELTDAYVRRHLRHSAKRAGIWRGRFHVGRIL